MAVRTYEGVVENGQIRLGDNVQIPEHTKVYVVVPVSESIPRVRILSPRLANAGHHADFVKTVSDS